MESRPLDVTDLVAQLERVHKILDGLTVDDSDEWAEAAALVDQLSDKFHA